MSNFIVLVRDEGLRYEEAAKAGLTLPVKGVVYSVRNRTTFKGRLMIRLNEIVNPVKNGREEISFQWSRFRPVTRNLNAIFERKKTDA